MSILHQIALKNVPGIGDVLGRQLLSYCGDEQAVFKSSRDSLLKIPGIGPKHVKALTDSTAFQKAERELKFIERYRIKTLFFTEPTYPRRLLNCPDSPILLYFKGDCDLNRQKIISIVGTRNATEYGKELTRALIAQLKKYDPLIISGLAYGIDYTAHNEALKQGLDTIGVLGHGLDKLYPDAHRSIAQRMLATGGLLTEFPSETRPDRENFPQRNRIVAGISDATIVVEAGITGGALITAGLASGYNRDVYAFPGRVTDEYSAGCHKLIKSGKTQMLCSPEDFEHLIGWVSDKPKANPNPPTLFPELIGDEKTVYDLIAKEQPASIDLIMIKTSIPVSTLSKTLLNLEFNYHIKQLPGKRYVLR